VLACDCCLQAAECEQLNEQQEQLQGVSLEAEALRQKVQELRQSTADLPALRAEMQELQELLQARRQLQQGAEDADKVCAAYCCQRSLISFLMSHVSCAMQKLQCIRHVHAC
jgi:Tfp pilus assembly protein PilO